MRTENGDTLPRELLGGGYHITENRVLEQAARSALTSQVKCFEHSTRCLYRVVRLLTALHEGFWLGCLSADDLNAVTSQYYAKSQYYLSTEHNLGGLFKWETAVLDRHFRKGSRILLAAAGAGRELLALRKNGFDAEGFDCSSTLIDAGQQIFDRLGETNPSILCAPESVPPRLRRYDGVIVGWSGYTHIPTKVRRIRFLRALRERAVAQAPLLISFFARRVSSRYETYVCRTARLCRLFLRGCKETAGPGNRLSFGRYDHSFTSEEIRTELTAGGFRLEQYGEENELGYAVGITE